MFDFFFALFGGLGYAAKSSYNKSKSKSVENRRRGYEITEMAIRRYDTPKTLADGWVMLNEIEDDLVRCLVKIGYKYLSTNMVMKTQNEKSVQY